MQEDNADKLGTDKFEVSWHGTARPEHQEWQGKVYTKEQLASVCGLGSVTGLLGANCRHTYFPFIEGVSERIYTDEQLRAMNERENKPKYYNGKPYTSYEATQRQRYLETSMRAQRQKIKLLEEAGADEQDITLVKCKYRRLSQEYTAFSKQMGLPQERDRIYADGLGRVDVKIKEASIAKNENSGIIKKTGVFKTTADPMKEVTGEGVKSNPEEIKSILEDLYSSNVEVEYRKGVMCYEPGLFKGSPGRFVIDESSSYSAWLHEYTHFLDDREDGFLGMRVFRDTNKCIQREIHAYNEEINLAKKLKRNDIVERLEKLKQEGIAAYERRTASD